MIKINGTNFFRNINEQVDYLTQLFYELKNGGYISKLEELKTNVNNAVDSATQKIEELKTYDTRVLNLETNKQNKTDNNLTTDSKDVVGAINEIDETVDMHSQQITSFREKHLYYYEATITKVSASSTVYEVAIKVQLFSTVANLTALEILQKANVEFYLSGIIFGNFLINNVIHLVAYADIIDFDSNSVTVNLSGINIVNNDIALNHEVSNCEITRALYKTIY